jgi:site-specific DNA recombinase
MPAKLINATGSMKLAAPAVNAVLYTRVSSREQEQEGYSLDAQQRLLRAYASELGIFIEKEFVDVETARASGRTQFGEMLNHLRRRRTAAPIILVEKTDRLYRNITDWGKLVELGATIHFVKEGVIIGPGSKSADQLVHGIKVVLARNYSQNLGE